MGKKWSKQIENESENKTSPHTHFNIGIENIWNVHLESESEKKPVLVHIGI